MWYEVRMRENREKEEQEGGCTVRVRTPGRTDENGSLTPFF